MIKYNLIFCLTLFWISGWCQVKDNSYDKMLQEHYEGTVPLMQPEVLFQKIKSGEKIYILDAREEREYNVSYIKGALHVGFLFFSKNRVESVDKNAPVIVYCTIGARSESVGERLQKKGFTNVYNLYGGIIQWKNEGYPLYDNQKKETEDVHVYSKKWGQWLTKGNPRY